MADFNYDVAFSFLGRDELLARKLNDILADRLKTFIYSDTERQVLLAGRDGEEAFARIFGAEARTVVVLYREGWGDQGFTAAESTGIRNRAMEEGYDFTTFIPLDSPPVGPRWLPRGRLWFGLEKYGVTAAAAVIESRVQEAGGSPQPETAETVLAAARRRIESEAARDAFLNSEGAAQALPVQFWALFDEFSRLASLEPKLLTASKPSTGRLQFAILSGLSFRMLFALSQRFGNTSVGSELHVTEWEGEWWGWQRSEGGAATPRQRTVFCLDQNSTGTVGWGLKEGDAPRFVSNAEMATWAVDRLMTLAALERAADRARRERR